MPASPIVKSMHTPKSHGWIAFVLCLALTAASHAGEIHKASEAGDADKVRALLTAKPELVNSHDASDDTPLHIAARKGQLAIVKVLLEFKADLNAANANRVTPLKLAKGFGHREVADLLQQNGAQESAVSRPAPRPTVPASPPEDPQAVLRKMEEEAGREPISQATEWTSTNFNYSIQLPEGWKHASGQTDGPGLTVVDALRPTRNIGVMVFDATGKQARLDDKSMAEMERGFFAKGRATRVSSRRLRIAGQPGYELRGAIVNSKGTILLRLVVANGFIYCISGTKLDGDVLDDPQFKQSLESFRFLKTPKSSGPNAALGLNSEKVGYVVGYLLGAGLVVALLVAGIVALVRRRSNL